MAPPFSGQGKQHRKITVRQVMKQLEADDSDPGHWTVIAILMN